MSTERRLLRDLKELASNPLLHVIAAPLENNIFEWHGNMTGSSKPFDSVVFHFVLKFPPNYPLAPPQLTLSTSVPHRNVFTKRTPGSQGFDLCLDMLENDSFYSEGHLALPYTGWSTAYSVYSVLLQLQAFLLDPEFIETASANRPSLDSCLNEAKKFKCSCGHHGASLATARPSFSTESDFARARDEKVEVTRPSLLMCRFSGPTEGSKKTATKVPSSPSDSLTLVSTLPNSKKGEVTVLEISPDVNAITCASGLRPHAPISVKKGAASEWSEWKGKIAKPVEAKKLPPSVTVTRCYSIFDPLSNLTPACPSLSPTKATPKKSQLQQFKQQPKVAKQTQQAPKQAPQKKLPQLYTVSAEPYVALTYQHKPSPQFMSKQQELKGKHKKQHSGYGYGSSFVQMQLEAQRKKTNFKKENLWPQHPHNTNKSPVKQQPQVTSSAVIPQQVATPPKTESAPVLAQACATVKAPVPTAKVEIHTVVAPEPVKVAIDTDSKPTIVATNFVEEVAAAWHEGEPSGLLVLPFEITHTIIMRLSLKDIMSVSLVCKHLNLVVEDGLLWRQLFSKHHPISQFTAKNLSDWKYLFQMEVSRIFDTLKCYHSKSSFTEDVLGLPLQITENPRLQEIDYIHSHLDLLSADSYFKAKVRNTVWKEKFTHWLPLYIDHDHFERSMPFLERAMVMLSPHWKTQRFSPYMVAEVIPKMMNTMVVLLSDKGIHASEKALSTYCALHRLFIALVKKFPALQKHIDVAVSEFCADSKNRHKSSTPNLGHFLPLLSVSSVPWSKVLPFVLSEMYDRNFIWVAKKHPGLANTNLPTTTSIKVSGVNVPNVPGSKGADFERLSKTFEASSVSLRLIMFHVQFLQRFRRVADLGSIALSYDRYYGFPSYKDLMGFQRAVGQILQVSGWSAFYKLCQMKMPTPAEMTKILVNAVKNSRKKKYHTDRTDFSKIHASGVSKILLKGESYTCNTNLKTVRLEDIWKFPQGKSKYLDASCLIYFFDETKPVEYVDYCRRSYNVNGAISHSGDMIDGEKSQGKHIITVDLTKLPKTVSALYFTITAFYSKLTDILSPEILFMDPDSDQQLCSYQFADTKSCGNNSAVVMAKMERKSADAQWQVIAIGHLGMGMAGNYGPIEDDIKSKNL